MKKRRKTGVADYIYFSGLRRHSYNPQKRLKTSREGGVNGRSIISRKFEIRGDAPLV